MLEHVHPNLDGYFQLASAYFPALVQTFGPPAVEIDDATARAEIPVTEVDRLHGEYRVAVLRNDWPFVAKRQDTNIPAATNRIEEIAQAWFVGKVSWTDAMNEALTEYQQQGNLAEAARVAVNLADAFVTSAEAQYKAGGLLLRTDAAARGLHYMSRAATLDPAKIEYRMSVAQAQFMLEQIRRFDRHARSRVETAPRGFARRVLARRGPPTQPAGSLTLKGLGVQLTHHVERGRIAGLELQHLAEHTTAFIQAPVEQQRVCPHEQVVDVARLEFDGALRITQGVGVPAERDQGGRRIELERTRERKSVRQDQRGARVLGLVANAQVVPAQPFVRLGPGDSLVVQILRDPLGV